LTGVVLAVALLFFASPAFAQTPSFRAFWADAFKVGFKSPAEVDTMIARAKAGNFNAIIVEVLAFQDDRGTGHGAYWDSDIVPRATDIAPGFDPLAYLVSEGHANGLEIHAWIVPFRVSYSWPPRNNAILAAHPEWLMVPRADVGGGAADVGGIYVLDPGATPVQNYLADIVAEIVTNYDVDGLNLDYIRYTQSDAGYPAIFHDESGLARFQRRTGSNAIPFASGDFAWDEFRRQSISEIVRRLHAQLPYWVGSDRSVNFRLTADTIPWGNAPAGGDFTRTSAYGIFQDWKRWLDEGWLDAAIPMNYKREWSAPQDVWYRNWVDVSLSWAVDRHVYMGQAPYMNPFADTVTQLAYALDAGCEGVVTFSYFATADANRDNSWESNMSFYPYLANNLFTQSVPTPTMPWRDPLTATEGTLWGAVVDGDGLPLDGVTVSAAGRFSVTDGNGFYVLSRLPTAFGGTAYSIEIATAECGPQDRGPVVVRPGDSVRFDVAVCGDRKGDFDGDDDIDFADFQAFYFCLGGPARTYADGNICLAGDFDDNGTLDLRDLQSFQQVFAP
jgi:uncharacterized lipoprotein YddW (UPF0748 family)